MIKGWGSWFQDSMSRRLPTIGTDCELRVSGLHLASDGWRWLESMQKTLIAIKAIVCVGFLEQSRHDPHHLNDANNPKKPARSSVVILSAASRSVQSAMPTFQEGTAIFRGGSHGSRREGRAGNWR
jgi:hypothetical protein